MSRLNSTIYLVDDDAAMLKALSRLLKFAGYHVLTYSEPLAFLESIRADTEGCIILDVAMPGLDGLQLQQELSDREIELPIIFLTGHGDIPKSVRAIKRGAVDFLTKPVQKDTLLPAICNALAQREASRSAAVDCRAIRNRLASLTRREHEVMRHVVAGKPNKQIAHDLGIVEQTIKVHRGRVMQKMRADSLADLVRMADRVDLSSV